MINETGMTTEAVTETSVLSRFSHCFCAFLIAAVPCGFATAWSQSAYGPPGVAAQSKVHPQVEGQGHSVFALSDPRGARSPIAPSQTAGRRSASIPQSPQYTFGNITIPAALFVQPNAINNDAAVVGFYLDASYISHGFVWRSGSEETIDYPGAAQTAFTGINNRGILAGTYQDASYNTHAFTYSLANASWTDLPALPGSWQPLFGAYGVNAGINDNGEVVGCASGFIGTLSWAWHPDSQSYTYFTSPAASEAGTSAQGINGRQSYVGSMSVVYSNSPFVFLREFGDRYTTISLPSSLSSAGVLGPFGINDSDAIVGTFYSANFATVSGFIRYRNGAFSVVNEPGADQTYLTGINDFGVLVGDTYNTLTGASPGFVAYPKH